MADFLNIPGNIRQIYLPFSIAGAGQTQVFSFKPDRQGQAVAQIFPFPKTFQQLFNADSGFQYSHGPNGSKKIEYKDFLDQIPSVQIREFVPDARLTQTFKWFSYLKRGFDAATKNVDFNLFQGGDIKSALEDAMKNMSQKMRDITSGSAPLLAEVAAGMTSYYRDKGFSFGADAGFAVLWIPFLLYYRLTTTKTNTIYELPYNMQNPVMKSDGTYGWNQGGNGFSLLDIFGEKSGLGGLISAGFGSTLRVNFMPHFDPSQGTVNSVSIQITIDLINDSDIAACNNFLLCHTLFGNNKWLQYGFVQASASLYDIKLPGANRYFMCSGQFNCTGKGAFRSPSDAVINYIFSHANTKSGSFDDQFREMLGDKADTVYHDMALSQATSDLQIANQQKQKRSVLGRRSFRRDETISPFEQIATRQVNTSMKVSFGNSEITTPGIKTYALNTEYPNGLIAKATEYEQHRSIINDLEKNISNTKSEINDATKRLNNAEKAAKTLSEETKNARDVADKARIDADKMHSEANEMRTEANKLESKGQIQAAEELRRTAAETDLAANTMVENANNAVTEAETAESENKNVIDDVKDEIATLEDEQTEYEVALKNEQSLQNELIEERAKDIEPAVRESLNRQVSSPDEIRDLIKIPDVYHLELTFNSLIPDNFNTYLYGFREANLDMFKNYAVNGVDETGVFEKLAQKLAEAVGAGG